MKICFLLATSALMLVLPGCATTGNTMASTYADDGYDHAYMARVERAARNTGTELKWINPPKAKKPDVPHD